MSFLFISADLSLPLVLLAVIGGYLSGSVPYGLILSRLAGLGDIRKAGSGNIGATNVLRVGGKKIAAITLLLDMLKGFVPVFVARQIHVDYAVLAAFGALFGHLFPVWLSFKGGKGVATGIGVMLGLSPLIGLAIIAVWLITAFLSKYSSLSALTAFGLSPVFAAAVTKEYQITLVSLLVGLIIWARHHENIHRLYLGTETKINLGSKKA